VKLCSQSLKQSEISMINRMRIVFTLFGCAALLAGCSAENPVGTVKGTASLKGKPYSAAAVMFISLEKGAPEGTCNPMARLP
jgi:hypothetical protein